MRLSWFRAADCLTAEQESSSFFFHNTSEMVNPLQLWAPTCLSPCLVKFTPNTFTGLPWSIGNKKDLPSY